MLADELAVLDAEEGESIPGNFHSKCPAQTCSGLFGADVPYTVFVSYVLKHAQELFEMNLHPCYFGCREGFVDGIQLRRHVTNCRSYAALPLTSKGGAERPAPGYSFTGKEHARHWSYTRGSDAYLDVSTPIGMMYVSWDGQFRVCSTLISSIDWRLPAITSLGSSVHGTPQRSSSIAFYLPSLSFETLLVFRKATSSRLWSALLRTHGWYQSRELSLSLQWNWRASGFCVCPRSHSMLYNIQSNAPTGTSTSGGFPTLVHKLSISLTITMSSSRLRLRNP
jgi:hypothetical protein